jgi:hypothetical protein
MKNKNKKKLLATIIAMMFTIPAHAENKILQNEYVRAGINESTDATTSGKFTVGYEPTKNGIIALTLGTQNYKGTNINSAALQGTIRF